MRQTMEREAFDRLCQEYDSRIRPVKKLLLSMEPLKLFLNFYTQREIIDTYADGGKEKENDEFDVEEETAAESVSAVSETE